MTAHNLGDDLVLVSTAQTESLDSKDLMIAVAPQSGGKIVQMPSGARIECGGELLRMALSNGGKIIGDAPIRTRKMFTTRWARG